MTRRLAAALVVSAAALSFALAAVGGSTAGAAGTGHAVVVVDFGDGHAHVAGISFASSSISGLAALQLAGYAPAVRAFGGNGGAVCALTDSHGTQLGCPTDSSCFTCAAPNYWAYFRAGPGARRYAYSTVGAGSTSVTNGSVEAWRWGPGIAPQFVSYTSVYPPPVVPTTNAPSATTAPSVGVAGGTTTVPSRFTPTTSTARVTVAPGRVAPTVPTTRATTGHGRSGSTATTSGSPATSTTRSARLASGRAPVVHGGGGSTGAFVGFVVLVALLLAAIVVVRFRRRAAGVAPAR